MPWLRVTDDAGAVSYINWDGRRQGERPAGSIEVPRPPRPCEEWDEAAGRFVRDEGAEADFKAGPKHIEQVHLLKYAEALMIEAGIELKSGLLVGEARARQVPVAELAVLVLTRAKPLVDAEVERQTKHIKAG